MLIRPENLQAFDPTARDFIGLATPVGPRSVINLRTHRDEFPSEDTYNKIIARGLVVERGHVRLTSGNTAAKRGQRYSEGGYDLNRMFYDEGLKRRHRRTPEFQIAQKLKTLWNGFYFLLDGHNTSNEFSTELTITEPQGFEVASHLPIDLVVSGFDKYEPGGTDWWMNQQVVPETEEQGIGITAEAGWRESPKSAELMENIILATLLARGHIEEETIRSMKVDRTILDIKPKKRKEVIGIYIAKDRYRTRGIIEDFARKDLGYHIGDDNNGTVPVFVGDADTKGGSPLEPGEHELLFVSGDEREEGQTGFLVVTDRPDFVPQKLIVPGQ